MSIKIFVIKNLKTGKYYTGGDITRNCTTKNLEKAEIFYNEKWVKGLDNTLKKNERFIEVEVKEKQFKK